MKSVQKVKYYTDKDGAERTTKCPLMTKKDILIISNLYV